MSNAALLTRSVPVGQSVAPGGRRHAGPQVHWMRRVWYGNLNALGQTTVRLDCPSSAIALFGDASQGTATLSATVYRFVRGQRILVNASPWTIAPGAVAWLGTQGARGCDGWEVVCTGAGRNGIVGYAFGQEAL